ncbi:MAG: GNAT family N-acetyltransferase [Anaerolineae bacterium]
MTITTRLEEPRDYRQVEEITRAAFLSFGRLDRDGIACPCEHWIVHELRDRDGILALSYVAEVDGRLVGHVIYSHARIEMPDGETAPVLTFGPISVQPAYQRQGVGKALMRTTIERAKDLGYGAIVFFGHPEYYPRFGFVEAEVYGVSDSKGANHPAFMARELHGGYLANARGGRFHESDIFDDTRYGAAIEAFDKQFR